MKINRTGITRIVIELNHVVIKIPNFTYSWNHFLKGIVANLQEAYTYRITKTYRPHLEKLICPVIFKSWGGFIIVMKKADIKKHVQEIYDSAPLGKDIDPEDEVKIRYAQWIDNGFGGDDKCDNYGYIDDQLVKVDYGQ